MSQNKASTPHFYPIGTSLMEKRFRVAEIFSIVGEEYDHVVGNVMPWNREYFWGMGAADVVPNL